MVSRNGIIPISATLGTVWPIARCVEDLANLLDTLVQPAEAPDGGYASAMVKSWDGIRIGTLDPEQFYFEADVVKPDKNTTIQMVLF
jgi:amidase